jgi:lysophospholipase L1-like esterase
MAHRFHGYVAVGDSFTEGMDDIQADGRYRGWADLVAQRLASINPDMAYANLAIRGKLFDSVVDDQVPAALRLRPDLVSFVAGGNDVLRPSFQPARIATRMHEAVRVLTASGAHVILITASAVSSRLPATGLLHNRFLALNALIRLVGRRHGSTVVDLWEDPKFLDHRMWSTDRLHMSSLGHQSVAAHVCRSLDIEPDPAWDGELPPAGRDNWLRRRRDDLAWTRQHLAPWVRRRLAGASSGDDIAAKRPTLSPMRLEGS